MAEPEVETRTAAIGVIICLCASALDSISLNLQRRDHIRNAAKPLDQQKNEFRRPGWVFAFILYISVQLFGSSLALLFLQPAVVAPLGAASLVFNFIFAYLFVGTRITNRDILGTIMIIIGAILIALFGDVPKDKLSLDSLLQLFQRLSFILYFSILEVIVISMFVFTRFTLKMYLLDDERRKASRLFHHTSKKKLRRIMGTCFAVTGGTIASQTVILTESTLALLKTSFSGNNQFTNFLPFAVIIMAIFAAILQVYCINSGLKVADATLISPVFFSFYSTLAFINSNVYYEQWHKYSPLNFGMMTLGLIFLIGGVVTISSGSRPSSRNSIAGSPTSQRAGGALNDSDGAHGELRETGIEVVDDPGAYHDEDEKNLLKTRDGDKLKRGVVGKDVYAELPKKKGDEDEYELVDLELSKKKLEKLGSNGSSTSKSGLNPKSAAVLSHSPRASDVDPVLVHAANSVLKSPVPAANEEQALPTTNLL